MNMAFTKIIDFKNIKSRNVDSNLSNYWSSLTMKKSMFNSNDQV